MSGKYNPAEPDPLADAGYRTVPDAEGGAAGRGWWDANAEEYLDEHGAFLGSADFVWCPEGLREEDVALLGDVGGRRVLEVGAGAAQCARWLGTHGAHVVATDVSSGMLAAGRRYDVAQGTRTPLVQADARALPFAADSFDVAFTAFGAIPFVPDAQRVHAEVARVLRPGGRWVFAVTHPLRWAFPDDPSAHGLTATRSYFDRRPYVETGESGRVLYAEYHRTVGDHVADLTAAGFVLERLVEPEWPAGHERVWGGWGPVRGARLPGTAIFVTRLR
ncbi:class I SAM-dependent methyltransferase [Cellulomonas septica]|uniref:Class I SAM-dependent methyltransferase n=1 Tax=Cellulomonas septica TaxID=285080 RepID=A0ABX1JX50_9CELL|nr:class I SAM-dependent methyltransferase [Cellulomonas septica]NKY38355.1 class I SAM-dependent methyltransferase [Cellulomonas septica]